jgi:hypothetical protein
LDGAAGDGIAKPRNVLAGPGDSVAGRKQRADADQHQDGQEQTGDPKAFPTPHDNLQNTMVEANQENDRVWRQPMTNGSLSAACANT